MGVLTIVEEFPDHESLQPKSGDDPRKCDEREREVEAAKLDGAKIAGDPYADDQTHPHADHAIHHQPAGVSYDLAKAWTDSFELSGQARAKGQLIQVSVSSRCACHFSPGHK
jgi:hypothetical protein